MFVILILISCVDMSVITVYFCLS